MALFRKPKWSRHLVPPMMVWFGGLFALIIEARAFDNTLFGERLFLLGFVPGIALGLVAARFAPLLLQPLPAENMRTAQAFVVMGVSFFLAAVACHSNRAIEHRDEETVVLPVVDEARAGSNYPWADVVWQGENQRLDLSAPVFEQLQNGEKRLLVTYYRGRWGYLVVKSTAIAPDANAQPPRSPAPKAVL